LQGFPSLYGFQAYLPQKFREFYPIPDSVSSLFGGTNREEYIELLRRTIVGDGEPEEAILLEIFPEKQKTRIDFELTKQYIGVEPVCLTKIKKEGRALFYDKDGRQIRIKRIYNRLIFDDLQNYPDLKTDFQLTDDVDVTWVGHPNWFFRISKYTLPFLDSEFVPKSYFLSDLETFPTDLENYVLKPLFSFAGAGVKIHVTQEDIDAIPADQRGNFLLQRKVQYEPVIQSPDGLVKCEIRMLFVWPENDEKPTLITNLARLSRGEMIGVNFNKNKDWVGGTICFFE
jgi:glutathionylspermidine synthase